MPRREKCDQYKNRALPDLFPRKVQQLQAPENHPMTRIEKEDAQPAVRLRLLGADRAFAAGGGRLVVQGRRKAKSDAKRQQPFGAWYINASSPGIGPSRKLGISLVYTLDMKGVSKSQNMCSQRSCSTASQAFVYLALAWVIFALRPAQTHFNSSYLDGKLTKGHIC